MNHSQVITLYRPTLQSIALQMLGSLADAEDIVHDTFLKWMTIDTSQIKNTKAFLIRTVTNKCINFLQKAKRSPKSLEDSETDVPVETGCSHLHDLEQKMSHAWSLITNKLGPVERAIYVLREGFNLEYEDLQHIVDKSADNCRQMFRRAKLKISEEAPKMSLDFPSIKIPASFRSACSLGYLSDLISELKVDFPIKKNFF